jgi:hypothetical protein
MSTLKSIHLIGLAAAAATALVALSACDSKPQLVAGPTQPTASQTAAPADQPPANDTADQSVGRPATSPEAPVVGRRRRQARRWLGRWLGRRVRVGWRTVLAEPRGLCLVQPQQPHRHVRLGAYTVSDGTKVVVKVYGQSGDNTGKQALALAQRYSRHCYLGRNNHRTEDREQYIFDYWQNPSGKNTTIPDLEDLCSNYNRNNLTVEDMGDGYGWRVKDHDHVLHLFDNESTPATASSCSRSTARSAPSATTTVRLRQLHAVTGRRTLEGGAALQRPTVRLSA